MGKLKYRKGMTQKSVQKCTECGKKVHHNKAVSIAFYEGLTHSTCDWSKGALCRECYYNNLAKKL